MSKYWFIVLLLVLANFSGYSAVGDTTEVQLFTFQDITKRHGEFNLPNGDRNWGKILMVRTLKCDKQTKRDKYPCGEWDYSTHTFVTKDSVKYELENFVTPYGKGLSLNGDKGWDFIYDVTDYAPILKGKVEIQSGNQQELLDMKLLYIEGTPVRNIISVENIYEQGSYKYEYLALDSVLKPQKIILNKDAYGFMLRARISGHGHNGPRNCCEWDSKTHTYFNKGEVLFRWNVWKNCGDNAIYPQGGTWQFDRAGWCPGTPVDTYDFELTNKVNRGDTLSLDYGIEMFQDNGEKNGNYLMSHQLFTYDKPNFKNDARIVDIVAPTTKDKYSRVNPICTNPHIIIQNTGSRPLQKLDITYGLKSGKKIKFTWNGHLKFLEKAHVILPNIDWERLKDDNNFVVEIDGDNDEYSHNNSLTSKVVKPMILPKLFFLNITAQGIGRAKDNGFTLSDSEGNILLDKEEFEDCEDYSQSIELTKGCYELRIFDRKEDGMIRQWWYRGSKPDLVGENGVIEILDENLKELKVLKYDFAEDEIFRFRVE